MSEVKKISKGKRNANTFAALLPDDVRKKLTHWAESEAVKETLKELRRAARLQVFAGLHTKIFSGTIHS
ncbi:MAG: hypothetical protein FWC51_04520 [Proteobacteria bacterium]|nr:hypothetical protein [Pseudomonadota bacterium]